MHALLFIESMIPKRVFVTLWVNTLHNACDFGESRGPAGRQEHLGKHNLTNAFDLNGPMTPKCATAARWMKNVANVLDLAHRGCPSVSSTNTFYFDVEFDECF